MFQGLFIDSFAGGGGASTGIAQAIGRDVDIAINHDAQAIAMHEANHPETQHLCQDIWTAIPIQVTKAQHVAGAWFSPDCKEHSKAKGGPVKDRNIRELAWVVCDWIEQTLPDVVYLENVEEFRKWGPLIEIPGKPGKWQIDPTRIGQDWRRWCKRIRKVGYVLEFRELRACDYGAPTSRKRLYVIARRDGLPIIWPKKTHAHRDSWGVKVGQRLPYRTAAECIDWSIDCPSIFLDKAEAKRLGVKRPLVDNTLRRVAHGVMRYVVDSPRPFIVPITHSKNPARSHDGLDPLRTITTANGGEFTAVDVTLAPHITKFHSGSVGSAGDETVPVVTGNGNSARPAGANPLGVVGATLIQTGYGEREGQAPRVPGVEKPIGTLMAGGGKHALVAATMVQTAHGFHENGKPRPRRGTLDIDKPKNVTTTSGNEAVVVAHIEKFNADLRPRPTPEPLDTVMAGAARFANIETTVAPLLDRQFGKSRGAAADAPAPSTMAGGGGKTAQVSAFLSTFHPSNTNGGQGEPETPHKAVLAGGQHSAVVCAHMEQANTGMVGHEMRKPISTLVGKGSTQRLVQTTLLPEDALPPEMMRKANRVAAFLVKYYETGVPTPVDKPFDTITTLPRFAVVTVTIDAVTYVIVDIGLRMLTPRELARAQGFPDDYILDPYCWNIKRGKKVWSQLTKADQIRMIGNSVCPDVACALVRANQPGANDDWIRREQEERMAA